MAVVVVIIFLVRRRQQSYEARTARALLGVSSRPRGEQTPSTSVPGSCISSMSGSDALTGFEVSHPWNMPSLAKSPSVPCCIRFVYPIFTLLCCGLFILADLSETAHVNVKLLVAGAPHHADWEWSGTMASLTLLRAARDAWQAGAKLTAIVLGLLNGFWPFLQTVVLLPLGSDHASVWARDQGRRCECQASLRTVWFLPGWCLSPSSRGGGTMALHDSRPSGV